MMTEKRKNKNKLWYWGGGLILIVVVVIMVVLAIRARNGGETGESEAKSQGVTATMEEKTDKKEEKEEKKTEDEPKEEGPEEIKDEIVQYDGDDPNENEDLSGAITYAGVSGGKLTIRVNIDQYLEDGVCSLVLRQGSSIIYSDAAGIVGGATTATCEGFDVAVSELKEGEAEIEIRLNADEKTGVIRGEVEI